jgi:hypothetical protein
MKKIILLSVILSSLILGVAGTSFSQEESGQYIHKGLFRSMGGIAPGIMLKENVSTVSLTGNVEYYIADNISLRGDSYFYMQGKDKSGKDPFEFNHSTFSGASYHFKTKNHFDPYFAFEPGIAISKKNPSLITVPELYSSGNASANPLLSSALGFNFYFQKWFHLFAEARYISGKHLSDATAPLSLNELRFSFGLGWNINLVKKK